jgi:carbonic anhydrase
MKWESIALGIAVLAMSFNAYSEENKTHHGAHWGYADETGPEHWADLSEDYITCKIGEKQSPIDLREFVKAELPPLEFNYQTVPLKVANNGHTIQVDQKGAGRLKFQDQEYQLLQFHFHTPSEHHVAGQPRDMEAHFVHKNAQGQLAVVGVLIKSGKENEALKTVLEAMPKEVKEAKVKGAVINAGDILPRGKNYQHYIGSLTTPPCSEGVRWIVMNEPIEMSPDQIEAFKTVFPNNARPVQPLEDRFLLNSDSAK